MIRRTRTFVCLAVMSLAWLATEYRVSAQTQIEDGWLGTWKENVDKSTYRPGPAPKAPAVAKWERDGQGLKITMDVVDDKGAPGHWVITSQLDGKDAPVTGGAAAMTRSVKLLEPRTFEIVSKMGGKELTTTRAILSPSGQLLRFVTSGTNAQGQAVSDIIIWEKQ
jgi:hypothetical protein